MSNVTVKESKEKWSYLCPFAAAHSDHSDLERRQLPALKSPIVCIYRFFKDTSWIFGHTMNGNQSKMIFTWIQFDSNPCEGSNISTINQFPVDVPSWDDLNSLGVGDGVGAILLEVIGCPLSPVDASNKANSPLVLKNYIREQQRIDTITHY